MVGSEHVGEHGIIIDGVGEPLEEVGDLVVGAFRERREGLDCVCHRGRDQPMLGLRDVQQITGVLHDHQAIARHERPGQVTRDRGAPIAAVDQHLALDQLRELGHRSLCLGDLMAR